MRNLKNAKVFPSLPDMKPGSPQSLFSPFNMGGDENSMTPFRSLEPSFSMQLNSCLKPNSSHEEDDPILNESGLSMIGSDYELPNL